MSADEFYLQDSRTTVGNDMLFWAIDGRGYTTNLLEAGVFTKAAAFQQHASRHTDIPWSKAYIDGKARRAVDIQTVSAADEGSTP